MSQIWTSSAVLTPDPCPVSRGLSRAGPGSLSRYQPTWACARLISAGPGVPYSRARMMASTVSLASPKSIELFSRKKSGLLTPA